MMRILAWRRGEKGDRLIFRVRQTIGAKVVTCSERNKKSQSGGFCLFFCFVFLSLRSYFVAAEEDEEPHKNLRKFESMETVKNILKFRPHEVSSLKT